MYTESILNALTNCDLMPTTKDHQRAYLSNNNFRKSCHKHNLVKTYPQWGVIILFYEIIHLIEKALSVSPIREQYRHSHTHNQRYETLQRLNAFIPLNVMEAYQTLKNASEKARYYYDMISYEDYKGMKIVYDELRAYFKGLYDEFKRRY